MTKSELTSLLAARFPQLVRPDAVLVVDEIIGGMVATLRTGGRVEIRGFGVFSLNYRSPRIGRNPRTGENVAVPGKHVPYFKAGKELREAVDVG